MNIGLVALFVVVDVVATIAIVLFVLRRRGLTLATAGSQLKRITEVSREIEQRTENALRTQWSGDPSTLPLVLSSLVGEIEADLRARELPLDRAQLRVLIGRVIEARGLAEGHDVREAMKQVA